MLYHLESVTLQNSCSFVPSLCIPQTASLVPVSQVCWERVVHVHSQCSGYGEWLLRSHGNRNRHRVCSSPADSVLPVTSLLPDTIHPSLMHCRARCYPSADCTRVGLALDFALFSESVSLPLHLDRSILITKIAPKMGNTRLSDCCY